MNPIDLATLDAAIKRAETEIGMFPEAEFPVEHQQARTLIEAGKAYLADVWQPIDTAPRVENDPFLVLLPGNDVAPFIVLQVSIFEGRLYPDARDGCIDWEDGITTATHWKPCPALPGAKAGAV